MESRRASVSSAGDSVRILQSADASCTTTPATVFSETFESFNPPGTTEQWILVTGGLGYIGSHTSLELLKAGYNVIVVDDLSNSFRDVFGRILALAKKHYDLTGGQCPKAEFYDISYRDELSMNTLLASHCIPSASSTSSSRRTNIVGVIHFASFKAVAESVQYPLKYYKNNVNGLVDFVALLEVYGIRAFVFSSSATVYGTLADGSRNLREEYVVHQEHTFNDTDGQRKTVQSGCTGITNPYGRTKYFGEAILSDIATSDPSWNIVALRYFNPVGCDVSGVLGEDPKGVPSNLLPVVMKVVTGQWDELSVFGNDWDTPDGSAVRDFIHVSDLARAHIAAIAAAINKTIKDGFRTINVGTGNGNSVLEVVSTMASVTGRPIPMKLVERRVGDVQSSVAAVGRAQQELGWNAQEDLRGACRDLWNYVEMRQATARNTEA